MNTDDSFWDGVPGFAAENLTADGAGVAPERATVAAVVAELDKHSGNGNWRVTTCLCGWSAPGEDYTALRRHRAEVLAAALAANLPADNGTRAAIKAESVWGDQDVVPASGLSPVADLAERVAVAVDGHRDSDTVSALYYALERVLPTWLDDCGYLAIRVPIRADSLAADQHDPWEEA